MSQLTAETIAEATGGIIRRGAPDVIFTGVSIDSRSVAPGEVFFAIRGPRMDGHDFIAAARARGARGAVVALDYADASGIDAGIVAAPDVVAAHDADFAIIGVADTHTALQELAHRWRMAWSGVLTAVTGSMGKTTTRDFACQLLSHHFSTWQTPGNYNNLFGLPLALLGLRDEHQAGIFEMGMSAAGEIAAMCRIARPEIGILTNVAPVHLEFFASLDAIAAAKGELVDALPATGTLIYNADDERVSGLARRFAGTKIAFGFSPAATVRAERVTMVGSGATRFELCCAGVTLPAEIPFAGTHYVENALGGVALALRLGMTPAAIVVALARLRRNTTGRGGLRRFAEGFTVMDDSYNSNPRALAAMIELLGKTPGYTRRLLVAGEMRELGADAPRLHFDCGQQAARQGIEMVIGVGGHAAEIVRAVASAGQGAASRFFADSDEAAEFIAATVRPGDLVLIKGSRGIHMEKIVDRLGKRFTPISDCSER